MAISVSSGYGGNSGGAQECASGYCCPMDANDEVMSEDDMPLVQVPVPDSDGDKPLVAPPPVPGADATAQNVQRRLRQIPMPVVPTRAQREMHNLTHLHYADWCEECVRSRGRNDAHRTVKRNIFQVLTMCPQ